MSPLSAPIFSTDSPFPALQKLCKHCYAFGFRYLLALSHLFCRYDTGSFKQIMGTTVQRHDLQSIHHPAEGDNQPREPVEAFGEGWRDEQMQRLPLLILQILLPRPPTCQLWQEKLDYFASFQNQPILQFLPFVPMHYHDDKALYPLPQAPQEGFRSGLSLQDSMIDESRLANSPSV